MQKKKIAELYDNHQTPKGIHYIMIRNENYQELTMNHVNNTIAAHKKEKYGKMKITLNELMEFCREKSKIPNDFNEGFVLGYDCADVKTNEEIWFRFIVTTKQFLQTLMNAENIRADSTFKLVVGGYPLLVIGATDMQRHFHPIALMLSTFEKTEDFKFLFESVKHNIASIFNVEMKPRTLIAYAASTIHNGFKDVFPVDTKENMCWYHVRGNMIRCKKKYLKMTCQIRMRFDGCTE